MLPSYRNILVATDFSPNSAFAFTHAFTLARHEEACIHLLHVIPSIDSNVRSYMLAMLGEDKLNAVEQQKQGDAQEQLTQALRDFADAELAGAAGEMDRFCGVKVASGDPAVTILDVADRLDADIIVIGTHGKGPLAHAFLGSVAERVIQKSSRPVLAIPLPKR